MRFLTGARLLSGILSPTQAGEAYAALAQAIVRVSFERVRDAFAAEHGTCRAPAWRSSGSGASAPGS
jgi:glutamate-ammonia-ligase adenylyltransferase